MMMFVLLYKIACKPKAQTDKNLVLWSRVHSEFANSKITKGKWTRHALFLSVQASLWNSVLLRFLLLHDSFSKLSAFHLVPTLNCTQNESRTFLYGTKFCFNSSANGCIKYEKLIIYVFCTPGVCWNIQYQSIFDFDHTKSKHWSICNLEWKNQYRPAFGNVNESGFDAVQELLLLDIPKPLNKPCRMIHEMWDIQIICKRNVPNGICFCPGWENRWWICRLFKALWPQHCNRLRKIRRAWKCLKACD